MIELKGCKMIFKCKHNELCKCGNKAEIMWLTEDEVHGETFYEDIYICKECLEKYTNYYEED